MLGYTHAVSGALGWLVVAPAATAALGQPLTVPALAAGTLACAGAALVPDLDHPQATVSQTFGPVSHGAAKFVQLASGGHRNATHSFLFAAAAGLVTEGIVLLGQWPAWIVMFVLSAFAIRGLGLVPPKASGMWKTLVVLAEASALVWALHTAGLNSWWWLGPAMFLGCLFHLAGDCCTPERCPLLWPKRTRYGFGLIAHTGNWAEKKVVAPVLLLLVFVMVWIRFLSHLNYPWNH